jgi:outer membrane protein
MTEETENMQHVSIPEPGKPKKRINIPVALSLLSLLVSVAALVIIFITARAEQPNGSKPVTLINGKFSIAWVNTDSILAKYRFYTDTRDMLEKYHESISAQYYQQAESVKKEYDDYVNKTNANQLSPNEQKKREEALRMKQQALQELENQLTQVIAAKSDSCLSIVEKSIIDYIDNYNKTRNYTFILERSGRGGILWADNTLEITDEVLKGLNEEYDKNKIKP